MGKITKSGCHSGGRSHPLQALILGTRLCQQPIPIVGRVATFQHLAEYPVGIVAALAGTLGVFIVDSGVNNHFAWLRNFIPLVHPVASDLITDLHST